jgi:hypothetical protein
VTGLIQHADGVFHMAGSRPSDLQGSLHPPRPVPSEQAKFVLDVCVASLNCRFSPGRLHPCPARAEVAMMAVSGSPAWVVRRGEPEVSAGGPEEG